MPAISIFDRRTFMGGDDLQPAVFLAHFLRLIQLTLFLIPAFLKVWQDSRGDFFTYAFYDINQLECRNSHFFGLLFLIYTISSTLYCLASAFLEWRISSSAGQGSPTETQPRSDQVSQLLEFKLLPFTVFLFLVFCTGISMVAFAPHYYRCKGETGFQLLWINIGLLLITQLGELLGSLVYLIHLCAQPRTKHNFNQERGDLEEPDYAVNRHELVEEMWAQRCARACQFLGAASCFLFGGREVMGQADFGDIARALSDYLETGDILDVVPSDIAVGFLVLQKIQNSRLHRSRQVIAQLSSRNPLSIIARNSSILSQSNHSDTNEPEFNTTCQIAKSDTGLLRQSSSPNNSYERESVRTFNFSSLDDVTALDEGARFARYALAIYTWVLYLYVHPVTGLPRLCTNGCFLCCGCGGRKSTYLSSPGEGGSSWSALLDKNGRIEGDNLCQSHKTALLLTADIKEADLVYLQLKSGFHDNPYCIVVDHEWKCVVVAIRGTFSLEDCVSDVLIEPETLDQLGRDFGFDADNEFCHGGVLMCVRNIHRDLQRHQILEKLLLGQGALFPNYTLRLVGHSLGAAVCTILSYMLRSRYPNLRCVNYSPPGCALSWNLAVGCQEWCTSFVLDSDIVPRLSFESMEAWRDEILELIGRIKVPKAEVVRRFMKSSYRDGSCNVCFDPPLDDPEAFVGSFEDILYEPQQVPDNDYKRQLERFKEIQRERRRLRGERRSVKLFPPGKMIHLIRTGESRECVHGVVRCLTCFTTNYGFRYTPVWIQNDELHEIVISPQMGADHFPNRMLSVINAVAKEYGQNASSYSPSSSRHSNPSTTTPLRRD